ncbi:transposase (plasmid) [Cupriavidus taiwanensis]|nr:transposase [Cupriavidus taiwanensis]SPD62502.1 transposase [Cupriavidus neocaledonicus]SPD69621.1 transposase [Cupriavidus taiwanensis]
MSSTPVTITAAELQLLRNAAKERDALKGKLRVVTVERDLLLERLKAFQRKLFGATSEVRGSQQKDLFLNEAETLAPTAATLPAQEEEGTPEIEVAGHKRKKRGRKPLDPALPRVPMRHELPESERDYCNCGRICPSERMRTMW